jgi:iron complex outermembrane recepter protein
VSYTYGRTGVVEGITGRAEFSRLAAALGPSMRDASGAPVCVIVPGDLTSKIPGCVPLNILGPAGSITPDQAAYVLRPGEREGFDDQHAVHAVVHGVVAQLPGDGEIRAAVGGDYRRIAGDHPPEPTGGFDRGRPVTLGTDDSIAGFADVSMRAHPSGELIRLVALDAGASLSSYQSAGTGMTYQLTGLVAAPAGLAARGSYRTALRAPTIGERMAELYERTPVLEDPCDAQPSPRAAPRILSPAVQAQCLAAGVPVGTAFGTTTHTVDSGGNLALRGETASVASVGLVYEPPHTGVSVAADYWRIRITHAIEELGATTILAGCYAHGNADGCARVRRDPVSHAISTISAVEANVATITTSGLDLAVAYDHGYGELGKLHGRLDAQYLFRNDLEALAQVQHGRGFYDRGLLPTYRANLLTTWSHPNGAGAGLAIRYVGSLRECDTNDCNTGDNLAVASRTIDSYVKLDLFASSELRTTAGTTSLQVGVNNLLDAAPPVIYNAFASSADPSGYDFMGRMVYARLSQRF